MLEMSAQELTGMAAALCAGRLPNGTLICMADRATHTVFTTIEAVRDLRGPKLAGVLQDATVHNSGGWQELLPVLKTGGTLAFELVYDPASHAQLLEASLAQSLETFELVLEDAFRFTALVELEFTARVVGARRAAVRLVLSGEFVKQGDGA